MLYFSILIELSRIWASLVAQLVKNPPAVWNPWVRKIPWRRERLPTPVFWPGKVHGFYSHWGCKESDTTERLSLFPVLEHLDFFSIRLMIPSYACFPNTQKRLRGSLGGTSGITVVFTGIFTLVR